MLYYVIYLHSIEDIAMLSNTVLLVHCLKIINMIFQDQRNLLDDNILNLLEN
jgi:hypothetical protein